MGPSTWGRWRLACGTGWTSTPWRRSGICAGFVASVRSVIRRPGSGPTTSPCWPATPTRLTPRPADSTVIVRQLPPLSLIAPKRGEMGTAAGPPHRTMTMRRVDRHRLRITRPPAGDRLLVRFRLPLLLLVGSHGLRRHRLPGGCGLEPAGCAVYDRHHLATVGF